MTLRSEVTCFQPDARKSAPRGFTLVQLLAVVAAIAAVAVILCAIIGCGFLCNLIGCGCGPAPPPPPVINQLEIVPSSIHVLSPQGPEPNRKLRLRVRLRDQNDVAVATNDVVNWTITDPFFLVAFQDERRPSFTNVMPELDLEIGRLPTGTAAITLDASVPTLSVSNSATITVYSQASATGQDRVVLPVPSPPEFFAQPTGAFYSAWRATSSCEAHQAMAFIGVMPVGNALADAGTPCNQLGIMSVGGAMSYEEPTTGTFAWGPGTTDEQNVGAPGSRLAVPVKVYIGIKGDIEAAPFVGSSYEAQVRLEAHKAARLIAQTDLGVANMIFDRSHAGMQFVAGATDYLDVGSPLVNTLNDVPDDLGQSQVGAALCNNPVPRNLPLEFASWYDAGAINIYYVDKIGDPLDVQSPGVRGWYCPGGATDGALIWISYGRHSQTTLAHELAHVLGIKMHNPETWNLMNANQYDGMIWADARSSLTLGQAFWVNVDDLSWLFMGASGPLRATSQSRDCTPPANCPRLTDDWP